MFVHDGARYYEVHMKYNIVIYRKLCHVATSEVCKLHQVRCKMFSCSHCHKHSTMSVLLTVSCERTDSERILHFDIKKAGQDGFWDLVLVFMLTWPQKVWNFPLHCFGILFPVHKLGPKPLEWPVFLLELGFYQYIFLNISASLFSPYFWQTNPLTIKQNKF